ncbi:histidine--tRNA ligase [Nitrosomonas ureae]|uniref:Histidine--tRNA ligase n=1 Tax=Nitrosomonas ureae TaxID=44577 RepID=A0A1H9EHW6_9PROT|nr:histidine--tRNA ligase [Nitrosomonas ureae]PTQ80443.1 histidyl-tRNA synthetase [Nitrosomonas ureae]PXX15562.1 histidyl-tRNA synthetase [Nitrosomonas ureae]SEQ24618.1 histidyl-tRNA synthetase [Nitrosomonas ureae]
MASGVKAIRGMNDILPEESYFWEYFEQTARQWLAAYGYRNIRTPIVEQTDLFIRSIGEVTDIVEKEMYTFIDHLNNDSLTLRPEGTASCARAAIEHNLLYAGPQKLYYAGPMFRHERPQKGRYRQFHQVGVEALGYAGPDIDAELIVMCVRLWKLLGISNLRLEISTLGNTESRALHRSRLLKYFERYRDKLDEDSLRRLYTNPLRILDSKNPGMQQIIENAPRLIDDLDSESWSHFESLQRILRERGINYDINLRLVRGLDYYNRTVFEWVTDKLGAQGTVCAGGRYDGLVEQMGGKSTPACGFAMGVERLLSLMQECGKKIHQPDPDIYIVYQGDEQVVDYAWKCAEFLRDEGFDVILHCGGGSFKSQMKKADSSGAVYALIIGNDEFRAQEVTIKPLRELIEQVSLKLSKVAEIINKKDLY